MRATLSGGLAMLALALAAPVARAVPAPQVPALPPPAAPAPVAVPGIPPSPPPALPPPVVDGTPPAPAAAPPPPAVPAPPAPRPRVGPVPTADATPAASDHDAVIGHVGIEARRMDPVPFPLALRPERGCPMAQTTPCTVELGALVLRYWSTRNLALNAGVALAFGGGSDQGRALDAYFGIGPVVGMTLLLGNWRHLAVAASPEASYVFFKPGGGSTSSTTLVDLRAALEGELHFGFIGVPALSVGLTAGLGFRYESTPDTRVWSIGVIGARSPWGALSNLFVRYYL